MAASSNWAEFLEVRDGIGVANPHRDRLLEIVFELANPVINGEITPRVLLDDGNFLNERRNLETTKRYTLGAASKRSKMAIEALNKKPAG